MPGQLAAAELSSSVSMKTMNLEQALLYMDQIQKKVKLNFNKMGMGTFFYGEDYLIWRAELGMEVFLVVIFQ